MHLAEDVFRYYTDHKDELSQDKLFHFSTRMAAWRADKSALETLHELKPAITMPDVSYTEMLREIFERPQTGRRNAHELRQEYFQKYPLLYGAHLVLFRVRHLATVYGIDARSALYEVINKEALEDLKAQLLKDESALRILSTFAINYIYLYERIVVRNSLPLPASQFLRVATEYDLKNPIHIQLLIYLYTHCIIGDSNFYTAHVPSESLSTYIEMLKQLEQIIEDNYRDINLDNKLEFLVCARICDYTSPLAARIYQECEKSVSPEGTFIIDRHNTNIQTDRNDFDKSEHRNVLFIMSTTPYRPHASIVE